MSDTIIVTINETPIEVQVIQTIPSISVSTSDHSALSNLAYANAGHTGFEPTVTKGNLTSGDSNITVTGGTGAVIGSGASATLSATLTGIDTLTYDTTYTPTGAEAIGTRYWDAANRTTSLIVPNGGILQDGQEVYMLATNLSGGDVSDGVAVSITTATGNRIAFTLADPSSRFSAAACIGLTTEPIANNATGRITILGQVHDLNTDAYTEGDLVYVDPAHPGQLTATLPVAPYYKIAVGAVEVKHLTQGIIMVRAVFIPKLTGLSDVDPTGLDTTGQILTWNQTSSKWVVSAGGGVTDHAALTHLAYADAGHTGFEPTVTKGNLTAASTKVSIGGTGTGAVIGTGASVDVNEGNLTHNNLGGLNSGDYQHLTASQVSALHPAVTISDTTSIDLTLSTQALSADVKADGINDTHIDWGTGTNQVSAVDLPIADSDGYYTGTNAETSLAIIGKSRSVSAHYSGFPNQADTSLSWDDGTYTLTLTASTDSIWLSGVEYSINTLTKALSVAQESASSLYWFWITAPSGTPAISCDVTFPGFDKCLVATVYWNTTTSKGILSDERHWFGRDQKVHEYLDKY
jgi:hypothetical protein